MIKIGIIGNGFVGKATQLLQSENIEQIVYDTIAEKCVPFGTTIEDINNCDLIFICLPTPMKIDGSCDTSILDKVLENITNPFVIIRSTIPIGYSELKNVYFMPEFLTENNWTNDFKTCDRWIVGLAKNQSIENHERFKTLYREVIYNAKNSGFIDYSNIYFTETKVAEMIKLIANCYLSTKVIFFNELYDLCQKSYTNYDEVVNLLKLDKRIGISHMSVPGYNGKRGYGGTCFPKDTNNLNSICNFYNTPSCLIENNLWKNEYCYRKEKDWLYDYGRTNNKESKPIVLVTGGAGFIGYHLSKKLLELGNNVIILDNFISGNQENVNKLFKFAKEIGCEKNIYFKKQDVQNKLYIPKVDYIYHLACPASPLVYQTEPVETIKTSIIGTINVLDLAVTNNAKVLFTSTSEIYGDPKYSPQSENYRGNVNCVGPRSCYDEGKRLAETLMFEYQKKYNLDCKIVRIFNTYGPNMNINDGRVITNFINCILQNKPLQIYGDGNQTRSFCYIDDIVEGILEMMNSKEKGPINLGNPDLELTINLLAETFENIIGEKITKEYVNLPEDDPKQRRPDINLAINKLNWTPKVSLIDGLKTTYEYFKNNL
jgi:UDP-glucuronate decarboxylase